MTGDDYQKGLMEGRLTALEKGHNELADELKEVVKSMKYMERVLWMLIGAGVFINVWPAIQALLS